MLHSGMISSYLAIMAGGSRSGTPWLSIAIAVLIACGVVGLLLIYPAIILRKYVRISIGLMDEYAPVAENGGHEPANAVAEEVAFRAADGHQLAGVVHEGRSGGPARGMVVFAHEVGSDRSSCLRYCKPVLDAGYDVFAFDFRGHGASPGEPGYRPRQWPSDREKADMLGAIAYIGTYLKERGRPTDVALHGVSRGAGSAILAAVNVPQVKAITVDSAYSSDTILEYLMRRWATIFARIRIVAQNHPPMVWRFLCWLLFRECARKFGCRFPSVRKAIGKLGRRPVLLIHGEKDSYIPIVQSQLLYDLARGPKYLWIVPGAKHNQGITLSPQEYGRRVVGFLDEHLAVVQPSRSPQLTFESEQPAATPAHAFAPAYASVPVDSSNG